MGIEKKTKPKRNRICYTSAQILAMEKVFQQSQYPDVTVLDQLAELTEIPLGKLCTWFQNRRAKFRRESKAGHIKMRTELCSYGQLPEDLPPVSPTEGALVLNKKLLTSPSTCLHHHGCCTDPTTPETQYQCSQTAYSQYWQQLSEYQQQSLNFNYMQPSYYQLPATETTTNHWSQLPTYQPQYGQQYDGYHGYVNQYNSYYGMQQSVPDSMENYSEIYSTANDLL